MRRRFGRKMYKVALDGGFTCPNRDGTLGSRGCRFCSGRGSGDFTFQGKSLQQQLSDGAALIASKNKGGGLIAYFQSFTNTYAPAERLRQIYTPVWEHPDVEAVAIATRPDCLPEDTMALLAELNRWKPLWVELGLQTIHPASTAYIRRGYDLSVYEDAVHRLKQAGLEVVTHMILGLPGESAEDMRATARYIGQIGSNGIKLQLLHVLKGTDLAEDYQAGLISPLSLDTYANLLCDCLELLPPDLVIHRLTGDGAKKDLLAPLWSADKKRVLNTINRVFQQRKLCQGSALT